MEIFKYFNTRLTPSSYLFADGYFSDLTFAKGSPTIFIWRSEKEADAPYMNIFKEAALQNYGKIFWAYSDIMGDLQREVAEFLQIGLKTKFFVRGAFKNKAYILEVESKDLTVDILTKFADDLLANKLTPTPFNSEAIPETNDSAIYKLVGFTHGDFISQDDKLVLVEYYAPWCGYCQKLAPKYQELAEHYQGNKDVIIAQFDATTNDLVAPVVVSGYPTLVLWKNGEPKIYYGENEVEDIKAFIEEELKGMKKPESVKDDL